MIIDCIQVLVERRHYQHRWYIDTCFHTEKRYGNHESTDSYGPDFSLSDMHSMDLFCVCEILDTSSIKNGHLFIYLFIYLLLYSTSAEGL